MTATATMATPIPTTIQIQVAVPEEVEASERGRAVADCCAHGVADDVGCTGSG